MNIDYCIIALFLLVNLLIGFLSSRRIRGFSQFSVGDRSFSSFVIFCTLSATFIGGGYTFGNAASVFSHGMVYAYALLGFSFKELLVAVYIAPRMGRYRDCLSIGDIIEKSYGRRAKLASGIFSVVICGGILGAQVGALSSLIDSVLNINVALGVAISLAVLLLYSSIGGMRAVAYTDVLQGTILFVGLPITLYMGINHVGGWNHILKVLPQHYFSIHYQHHGWIFFLMLFLSFMLGETLVPPYAQRLFMAKSTKQTFRGTLYSAIISVPMFLISGAIGIVAYVASPNIDANNAFAFIVDTMLPVGLRGFVIAALLSIILSSAAGFLNAAAISFTNDCVKPLSKRPDEINALKMARVSTLLVGLIAIIFAVSIKNVLSLLLMSYNFWSPIILVPMLFAIFKLRVTPSAFWVGAACGICGTLLWQFGLGEPLGLPALVFGIVTNFVGFYVAAYLMSPPTGSTPLTGKPEA